MSDKKLITESDTDQLFEGIEITPEAKADFAIKLEAQIISKVDTLKEELEAENATVIAEEVEKLSESMEDNINSYLDYVVESWAEDNAVAIEAGLKNELVEGFVKDMHEVFAKSLIELPDAQVDLVKESEKRVADLEASLASQIAKITSLKEGNITLLRSKVMSECVADLTDTQAEKLNTLAEGFDFTSLELFTKQVMTLKEAHFKDADAEDEKNKKVVTEEVDPMAGILADLDLH